MSSTKPKGVAAFLALLCLGGCGHSTPATAPTSTPSANPTEQAVDDAIHAYYGARKANEAMGEHPQPALKDYPRDLRVTDYLTDPALANAVKSGTDLAKAHWSIRTDMGLSTPKVESVDLTHGRVTLSHCAVDEKTTLTVNGQPQATGLAPGEVAGAHRSRFTMVKVASVWKMSQISTDLKSACAQD